MSTTVVMPPQTAAVEPLLKSSLCGHARFTEVNMAVEQARQKCVAFDVDDLFAFG